MKARLVVAALAAGLFASGASAQNMKPGLWEITHNMKSASGQMEKSQAQMQAQMANMPPEQRRMVEEMMAKQGMKMGAGGPGGMSARVCMTKEQVERNEVPSERGDCKTTKNERKGNTIHVAFTCANPPSSGEGTYTVVSPEAYNMKMTVRQHDRNETMNMDSSGKWLGADCGSIKPMQRPAR